MADGYLEDGANPRTPPGDTMLLDYARAMGRSYAALAAAEGGSILDDPELGLTVTDLGSDSLFTNAGCLTRPLTPERVGPVLEALREFYGGRPGGQFLVFSPWPTPDLRPLGFELAGHPPFMVRPPGAMPPAPPGLEIVEVGADERRAAEWVETFVQGYPVPAVRDEGAAFFSGRPVDGWHHYLGVVDGSPVCCASAYVDAPHAVDIELVATLAGARGRGYGAAVTSAAAATDPSLPAVLLASDDGRPVYLRLGFRTMVRFTLWIGTRQSTRQSTRRT